MKVEEGKDDVCGAVCTGCGMSYVDNGNAVAVTPPIAHASASAAAAQRGLSVSAAAMIDGCAMDFSNE